MSTQERVRRERDLFRLLLELGEQRATASFLRGALEAAVSALGAQRGYVEVHGPADRQVVSLGCSADDVKTAQARISQGIIARAMDAGTTVQTPSALLDARFADRPSVRTNSIEAVVCSPMRDAVVRGVLYLEGRPGAGPFSPDDVAIIELFTARATPMLTRLLEAESRVGVDPTGPWRERLELDAIAGTSAELAGVFAQLAMVAGREVTVLLTGPSGCGKTAIASAIHRNGPRRTGPFVELNCATLPADLAEAELFGFEKGAHSTAYEAAPGKIEAAQGGTLFLDEVGELDPRVQPKLLTFLESRRYRRLGGSVEKVADVRIVAATNKVLPDEVAEGRFRGDLYFRLGVIEIAVPGLDRRPEDIGPIAARLIENHSETEALRPLPLSGSSAFALRLHEWPGNVREVSNLVYRGLLAAHLDASATIEPRHLFGGSAPSPLGTTYHEQLRASQRAILQAGLDACDGNRTAAAERLGIARSTFFGLLKSLGMTPAKG